MNRVHKALIYVGVTFAWLFIAALILHGSGHKHGTQPLWVFVIMVAIWAGTGVVLKELNKRKRD
jgi:hypothetical protein